MKPATILFIGPQGSGKGTQVDAISTWLQEVIPELPLLNIQTGKPFRALAQQGGYTAEVVKERIESGKLVPTILTASLVMSEFVSDMKEDALVMMDGFPRDLEQAGIFDEMLAVYDREEMIVVFLDTSDEVVTKRMLARGRNDDTEEIIKERLETYHKLTEPLLSFYENRAHTSVVRVAGELPPDRVTEAIKDELTVLLT